MTPQEGHRDGASERERGWEQVGQRERGRMGSRRGTGGVTQEHMVAVVTRSV